MSLSGAALSADLPHSLQAKRELERSKASSAQIKRSESLKTTKFNNLQLGSFDLPIQNKVVEESKRKIK